MLTCRLLRPRSRRATEGVDFWGVVASMPPGTPVRDMVAMLRGLSPSARQAFARHLTDAVAELDTPEHRHEMALAYEAPLLGEPEPAWATSSGTAPRAVRVELQLTVVALGRDTWQSVARTPALLRGTWPTQLGRRLAHALAVADGQGRSDDSGPSPSTT